MRLVQSSDAVEDAFSAAAAEAQAAFGDPRLYVEKAVSPARHVEIQVLCDHYGNVLTLGERECSIQRRHQKLIEESPSAALTPETREQMEAAAERACRAVGLSQCGHVRVPARPGRELLLHRAERAAPGRASRDRALHGHRHRARAAARRRRRGGLGHRPRAAARARDRDPPECRGPRARLPSVARADHRFSHPEGPGVRLDTFIESGSKIPPFYDSMVAKLIVWDSDRDAAIARAARVRCTRR